MTSQADKTILIVEDEPVQAMKLQLILQEHGHRASVARSADEALAMMEATVPHLVVSDIVMPGMDGYSLCERIRADARFRNTRVILLTSHSEPADVLRGLASGADSFVVKPFDATELLENVGRVLGAGSNGEETGPAAATPVSFGDLEFRIRSSRRQILNFFLSAYEGALRKSQELVRTHEDLKSLTGRLEVMVRERTTALSAEVAERKRAEQESRERAALLDRAQDAILVLDLAGKIVYWNRSAERLYGWPAEEAVGRSGQELLHGSEPPREPAEALRTRGEWLGELHQRTRDDRSVVVQSRWTLVRDEQGEAKSTLIINTDITDRKKLEQQFLRTQRLESIGTLAGGIAHDLNNLLAPILLAIDILRQQLTDERGRKTIGLIESSARRAADMVKQVLTFARGVEGERIILQPAHLLKEMAKIAEQSFPKSVDLVVSYRPGLFTVTGDATQLHQVLMNLCVNARDAMPHGGTIKLTAENLELDRNYAAMNPEARPGPYVLLRVQDSGSGMPPEVLEKIFEPFFTTKEVGKGTGLGLSTVMAIVRSHNGFIRVESEPGKGTEFKIYIPANVNDPGAGRPADTHEMVGGNGELVLVVDDERVIREITRASLEDHGYKVVDAEDGTGALVQYASHAGEIQVVILDMIMPYLDGPATIRALLKMDPDVRIIGVSGLSESVTAAEKVARKPIPFLPKPYTTEQLLETIDQVLHHHPKEDHIIVPGVPQ